MSKELKILIIEDNPNDLELLLYELKKTGFIFTHEVVQSKETLENRLNDFQPDLILSDFNLPSFDGLSAFYIKQEIAPEIPFILVSGAIGEEKAVEFIKIGMTDCTQKEKLFTLGQKIIRAINEADEKKEKRITDKKVKEQHEKLLEIAFLQSHQIRRPVANILGLINLFNLDNPRDEVNLEVLFNLEIAAKDLDNIIHEITKKTSEI